MPVSSAVRYVSAQGLARWVLGMMLAVQLILTVQPCVLRLPASSAMAMTAPCEGAGAEMGAASCLIQCQKTADQIKPSVDFHFDALPPPVAWTEMLFIRPASRMAAGLSTLLQRCSGPPLQVLFCSFQS